MTGAGLLAVALLFAGTAARADEPPAPATEEALVAFATPSAPLPVTLAERPALPRAVWPASRVAGLPAPRMLQWLDNAPQVRAIAPWLQEAGQAHGVDPDLLKALIAVESRFDPQARSQMGALGLMQIMPTTANTVATAEEKRKPAAERLLDPRINIHTGARLLSDLIARFGRLDLALAAWNAGEGAVKRQGNQAPPNTLQHIERVLALYAGLLQQRLEGAAAPAAASARER
ncbi:lytic transglycosylase domain-containing protein [Aquabacterium sp. J223]|uniref:lytic transglycosylase domain-containing protein n=1 Tax=Aquabacterium sp. J223 TaxID=2898431 RepID=UPI0021ADDA2E|nr:lytic transglycosylase domain-containing protein [Aquabacterium sp. J223]UUX95171.1 lytic transglycosylase domain-containing protein [Aquabacterium sp. J223]